MAHSSKRWRTRITRVMNDLIRGGESKQAPISEDLPGIVCPAPVLLLGAFAIGLVLDLSDTLEVLGEIARPLRLAIAASLMLGGAWFTWAGNVALRRVGTDVLPARHGTT